jgi:pimeloyl-ACP methyl ester carboxylesterase
MTTRPCCHRTAAICRSFRQGGLWACLAVGLVLVVSGSERCVGAQEPAKKEEIPAPVELGGNDLISGGVQLAATYRPGTKGKESVPVILLHMSDGSRKDYFGLASYLQRQGCAVLAPDLRGHGDSTTLVGYGTSRRLDADKMSSEQYLQMAYSDMDVLWRFLAQKNDEGELNLSKLCVVGAEMGAAVAVYFAAYDWTRVVTEQGRTRYRPHPDVNALVLLSPKWAFPGLPLSKPLSLPALRSRIPVYILVGREDPRAMSDARRVDSLLSRFRDESADAAHKTLFFKSFGTKLQGTKMLGLAELNPSPESLIGRFIELRLVRERGLDWRLRGEKAAGGDP